MLWWQWIILGLVLLGAEMMVDAEFYLVFLGVSAIGVGLLGLVWIDSPLWAEWVLFSVLSVASLLLFRSKVYSRLRPNPPDYEENLIGVLEQVVNQIIERELGARSMFHERMGLKFEDAVQRTADGYAELGWL